MTLCYTCGHSLKPGEIHCSRYGNGKPSRDHGGFKHYGFGAYVDEHLSPDGPVLISNPGDRKKYMRKQWRDDFLVQTDFYGGFRKRG